jgi:Taurine catabolism dioxygenase TauD, TfdA family
MSESRITSEEYWQAINWSDLETNGWISIEVLAQNDDLLRKRLLAIAKHLGCPLSSRANDPPIVELRPTKASHARSHSLSRRYSTGAFPCHTDTAHWSVPCRYILLACVDPGNGNRETVLLDSHAVPLVDQQLTLLNSAPFRIRNGKNSFFSTVFQKGRPFIRYDPGCMEPVSNSGEVAMSLLDSQAWPCILHRIEWWTGRALIIDNWRVLHGRGLASCDDPCRVLLRLYAHRDQL